MFIAERHEWTDVYESDDLLVTDCWKDGNMIISLSKPNPDKWEGDKEDMPIVWSAEHPCCPIGEPCATMSDELYEDLERSRRSAKDAFDSSCG